MTQPSPTLEYRPKPPLSAARRQSVRLLVACAGFILLLGVNFLGCDVIFFVNSRGPGRMPTLTVWHHTLFSFRQWHAAPAELLQDLVVAVVVAVLFLLTAWGVRRGRRFPVLGGMIMAFLVCLVGVLGCISIAALFLRLSRSGGGESEIIQAVTIVVIFGMITLFPLTGIKLLKVWREPKV